jgi:hypothetical protein
MINDSKQRTEDFSRFIESKRQEILSSLSTEPHIASLKWETQVTEGLPIIRDLGKTYALKSDLTTILLYTDGWEHMNEGKNYIVIESEAVKAFVVSIACLKYAELTSIRPVRPLAAVDCICCNFNEKAKCQVCEDLRWLPMEWVNPTV